MKNRAQLLRQLAEMDGELAAQTMEVLRANAVEQSTQEELAQTLSKLCEALKAKNEQRVDAVVAEIRHVVSQMSQATSSEPANVRSLPPDPEIFTSNLIRRIETVTGTKIQNLHTSDRTEFTIKFGGIVFVDCPMNLCSRIARNFFQEKTKLSVAIQYLALRKKGMGHSEAVHRVQEELTSEKNMIPIESEFFSPRIITLIEKQLGTSITSVKAEDRTPIEIAVDGTSYSDCAFSLFRRIAHRYFDSYGEKVMARTYLGFRKQGKSHYDAVKMTRELTTQNNSVPMDPTILTPSLVAAIEGAIGQQIGTVKKGNNTEFQVTYAGATYTDTPRRLFARISYTFFSIQNCYEIGRQYLVLRKSGLSHAQALERSGQRQEINRDYLFSFEQAAGKKLEQISYLDTTLVVFTIGSEELKRSPNGLFSAVSNKILNKQNASKGKQLCIHIRDGKLPEEAKRLVERDEEGLSDAESEKLSEMNLEEVIAFFREQDGGQMKLKIYLQFAYPEMSEQDIDRIVIRAFRNLYGGRTITKEEEYMQWDDDLPAPRIESGADEETDEPTVTITGTARNAECVHICGTWSRRVRVESDGSFQVTVPLHIGQMNELRLMSIDRQHQVRSRQVGLRIRQIGESDDVQELFRLLEQMSADLAHQISVDPGRREYLAECTERVLIRKFGVSFEEGETYVRELLRGRKRGIVRDTIAHALEHFRWIDGMQLQNVQEGSLMFFQKYCATKIRQAKTQGRRGINLCNDPGLGKTRTVWAALGDERATVFTPNSVVSTWNSEAHACLADPDLLVLDDASHGRRKRQLRSRTQKRVVTNTQFLQKTEDDERFQLVSGPQDTVVFDEAHNRKNEHSEQSKGARKIRHRFAVNVTATLARNPVELRRMLHTLDPDRPEFRSDHAFRLAFPANDPDALKSLKLIVDQYTIRFRKHEVMEEIDPNQPLEDQLYKLPRKERISPDELGRFEMSERQAQAIYELFMDWPEWCRKYGRYIPDDDVSREDRLWTANGLTKMHAYRQVINNPGFINDRAGQDPKAWQMQRIVKRCVKEGRKVVIFCRYEAQALKYAELLKKYHPSSYTGQVSRQGVVMDAASREPKRYSVDHKGHYVEDPAGEPMRMLEHECQRFQDDPKSQVLLVSYGAGSVGTTFTAGKATIYDDLPSDCKEDIQAEDRTHRIDPEHQTHAAVQYYQMQARYPRRFLERMQRTFVRKQTDDQRTIVSGWEEYDGHGTPTEYDEDNPWMTAYEVFFDQGTFDQFHSERLQNQRVMFHLINDGIGDESELTRDQAQFFVGENGNGSS
ncbi:DEAD/DEAH box helicase [Candidatus Peregrinibacteria bacterium]|nr:DEAD/DEAH box helicase [Candidatus Peregrinibacteria bacterium]